MRGDVVILVLGLQDLNLIGHDLLAGAHADLGTLHDLDLETEDTLTELDVTDSNVDELSLGLTSGDLVTGSVLLGLGTLTTNLTRDDNFATSGTTASHDGTHDVVGGHTDWDTVQELELEGLNVGGSGQVLVVWEWLDGELDLVVLVVEVVPLFNDGLDFSNSSGTLLHELVVLGGNNSDFCAH